MAAAHTLPLLPLVPSHLLQPQPHIHQLAATIRKALLQHQVFTHHSKTNRGLMAVSKATLATVARALTLMARFQGIQDMARSSLAAVTPPEQQGVIMEQPLVTPLVFTVPKQDTVHKQPLPLQLLTAVQGLRRRGMGHPREGTAQLVLPSQRTAPQGLLRQGMQPMALPNQAMAQPVLPRQGMAPQETPQQGMPPQQPPHQRMATQHLPRQRMAQLVLPRQGTAVSQPQQHPPLTPLPTVTPPLTPAPLAPQAHTAQATVNRQQHLLQLQATHLRAVTLKPVLATAPAAAATVSRLSSRRLAMGSSPMHSLPQQPLSQPMGPVSRALPMAQVVGQLAMVALPSRYMCVLSVCVAHGSSAASCHQCHLALSVLHGLHLTVYMHARSVLYSSNQCGDRFRRHTVCIHSCSTD